VAFRHLGINVIREDQRVEGRVENLRLGAAPYDDDANVQSDIVLGNNADAPRASHRISGTITIINQKTLKVTLDVDSEDNQHLDNISFEVVDSWL
jgi:hypothetical protein